MLTIEAQCGVDLRREGDAPTLRRRFSADPDGFEGAASSFVALLFGGNMRVSAI